MNRRWLRAAVVATVLVLVATACSSSSHKASTATSAAASGSSGSKSPAATGSPIPVGFICGCTGALASSIAISWPAYEAWVSYLNAHGGINGHPVKVYFKDDGDNPGTSVAAVHQLVQDDHIIALVDATQQEAGWASYIEQLKVPVIGQNISSLFFFENPDFFPEGQTNDSLPVAVVQAAKTVKAKNFGLLYCAESPICQELVGVEHTVGSKAGIPVSYSTAISASAPNYTAQCLAAKQAGSQSLFVASAVSVALKAAADCVQQGYNPRWIADDGAVSRDFATAPGWNNGMIAMQPDIPFFVNNTPATSTMYAAFKKYQPGLINNPDFNEEVVESWTAGLLFQAAAQAGGLGANGSAPASAQLMSGLYQLNSVTLGGMAPPLTFHQGKTNSVDCWFWMATQNHKFTMQYGTAPVCAPPA